MVYHLIFPNDSLAYKNIPQQSSSILVSGSLEEVSKERKLSGDIVVDDNGNIVQDDCWLFEWEKQNKDCYARKHIACATKFF